MLCILVFFLEILVDLDRILATRNDSEVTHYRGEKF